MEASNEDLTPRLAAADELRLDPDNPRLPEEIRGQSQAVILEYLHRTTVLDEIARSMVENGYFTHEPLLVMAGDEGPLTVLEGNRRVATLMMLLGLPPAEEAGLRFDLGFDPEPEGWRERLREIACFEVPSRDAVRRYLGFRHIGGTKPWAPQAKARYLFEEVNSARDAGADHPFLVVARRVGSNVQGVRNAVFAYIILVRGREDFGLDVLFVMDNRFGVWQRALASVELREFINVGWPRRLDEVEGALADLEADRLGEVLADMTGNGGPPLLADSRDITVYGQSLANPYAYDAMRRYRSLDVARQIVEEAELPDRIRRASMGIEAIHDFVSRAEHVDADVLAASEELANIATALRAVARDRAASDGH